MQSIKTSDIKGRGLPFCEVKKLFEIDDSKKVEIILVSIMPGQRVPETGVSCHDVDEYSYIYSGSIFSCVEDVEGFETAGNATFIAKGEKHWCRNDSDTPCLLVCVNVSS